MKRSVILLAVCSLFCFQSSRAAVIKPTPVLPASLYNMPLREFLQLSPREFSAVTGKHLNLEQRIAFGFLRSSMKKAVRKNPAITAGEYFLSRKKMKGWLKILLIILGVFLLAFIIFAIAYGAGQE